MGIVPGCPFGSLVDVLSLVDGSFRQLIVSSRPTDHRSEEAAERDTAYCTVSWYMIAVAFLNNFASHLTLGVLLAIEPA